MDWRGETVRLESDEDLKLQDDDEEEYENILPENELPNLIVKGKEPGMESPSNIDSISLSRTRTNDKYPKIVEKKRYHSQLLSLRSCSKQVRIKKEILANRENNRPIVGVRIINTTSIKCKFRRNPIGS